MTERDIVIQSIILILCVIRAGMRVLYKYKGPGMAKFKMTFLYATFDYWISIPQISLFQMKGKVSHIAIVWAIWLTCAILHR